MGASMTPKTHTKEALNYSYGLNLGYVSEKIGEALNQRLHKVWLRYEMNSEVSDKYWPNLLKAEIDFSSKTIKFIFS